MELHSGVSRFWIRDMYICFLFNMPKYNSMFRFFFIDYKATWNSVLLYILSALCGQCTIIWEVLNFHFDEYGRADYVQFGHGCVCAPLYVCMWVFHRGALSGNKNISEYVLSFHHSQVLVESIAYLCEAPFRASLKCFVLLNGQFSRLIT